MLGFQDGDSLALIAAGTDNIELLQVGVLWRRAVT
jgi:hypothetical protein